MQKKKETEILGLAEKIEGQSFIIKNCLSPFQTFGSPHDRVFQTFFPPIIEKKQQHLEFTLDVKLARAFI